MILFTVCAIVALDTIGQSSSYGAQTVFRLILSAYLESWQTRAVPRLGGMYGPDVTFLGVDRCDLAPARQNQVASLLASCSTQCGGSQSSCP